MVAAKDASNQLDLEWTSLSQYENQQFIEVGSLRNSGKLYFTKLASTPIVGWVKGENCKDCEFTTDDCPSCYVGLNEYLRKTFGDQPQPMLEIQGTDSMPTEWGRVAPYCVDYETPVGAVVNSIKFDP